MPVLHVQASGLKDDSTAVITTTNTCVKFGGIASRPCNTSFCFAIRPKDDHNEDEGYRHMYK